MQRSLTLKVLTQAEPLTKVFDKYGDTWVKVTGDEWLSSSLEMKSTKEIFSRRVVLR